MIKVHVDSKKEEKSKLLVTQCVSKLSIWHKSPRFLLKSSEKWPSFEPVITVHADSKKEEKSKLPVTQCVSCLDSFENDLTKRISSWKKTSRRVA